MINNPFTSPEHNLRTITAELDALNVPLPEKPAATLERWRKVVHDDNGHAGTPAANLRRTSEVTAAYVAGDNVKAQELATDAAIADILSKARKEARLRLAGEFLARINSNEVVTALAAQAGPLTSYLQRCAELEHLDVTAHVRAGDHKSADLAAQADERAESLNRLYRLKAQIIGRPLPFDDDPVHHASTEVRDRAILRSACSIWRNPHQAANPRGTSALPGTAHAWCSAIRSGLEPWFPILSDSDARAEELVAEMPSDEDDWGWFGRRHSDRDRQSLLNQVHMGK